jgi:hypothetical protein
MEGNQMSPEVTRDHARRNRMIAIAAGVITVIAIVLGFAGDFLGLPWHWMRPAAELLLLAELVGLVVLERHQLFEPVHQTVGNTHAEVMTLRHELSQMRQRLETIVQAPELLTNSEDYYRIATAFMSGSKHEVLMVVRGDEVLIEQARPFIQATRSRLVSEKQLHVYIVVASPVAKVSEASFQDRLDAERNPSLEGRLHFRFVDMPVTFGCVIFDQNDWLIDFPPNPADLRGGAILFKNYPEGARLLASFIRHQWLEQAGVTMSMGEAYEKWKRINEARRSAGANASARDAGKTTR